MKKRFFGLALALVMTLALAAPAFAEEEEPAPAPEYRLVSITQGGETYTFTYGQGGWLPTEVTGSVSGTVVTAAYDDVGRVASLVNNLGDSYSYEYDENDNLLMRSSHSDSTYGFDGNLTTQDSSSVYTYDENGKCIRTETSFGFGGELSTTISESTYDDAGVLVGEETTYGDGSVSTKEYTRDDAGNLLREETTYGDGSVSTTEYTRDAAGALLHSEDVYRDGSTSTADYTYDDAGDLLREEASYIEGDYTGYDIYEYTYDDEGRRVQVDYTSDYGSRSTKYIYTPLLTFHCLSSQGDNNVTYSLCDSKGVEILPEHGSGSPAEPQFTYDDNGYVTQVSFDGTALMVFTYEPVA